MKYNREHSASYYAARDGVSRQYVNRNQDPPLAPECDDEGYPTKETLDRIATWPCLSNFAILDLLRYVRAAWRYDAAQPTHGRQALHTCGWSGNEEIIVSLQRNAGFWWLCWLSSHRGGGFFFKTHPFPKSL